MASFRGQGGCLCHRLVFILGVYLGLPEAVKGLELLPSTSHVVLDSNQNFTVVCRGWSRVIWHTPNENSPIDGVLLENHGSSSTLQLTNATWKNSGRYTCEEASSNQRRDVDIFIPGEGPEEWFVPLGPGVIMKEEEQDTIPCAVSDPQLNVSLFQRPGRMPVYNLTYEASQGFTGPLNDTSYVCMAARGDQQKESQVYYVFSVVAPQVIHAELSVSSVLLKQGEVLTINCTVTETDVVYFNWDFPRKKEVEPLTDFLPNQIRSFINISNVTLEDSGIYMCEVKEPKRGSTVAKNVTVTVLQQGYIFTSTGTNVSSLLHDTVELSLEIDAYPAPTVIWTTGDNETVGKESIVTTTHLSGSRYTSKLTFIHVQVEQTGSYAATVLNDDDVAKVTFNLQIQTPPRIVSLSESNGTSVLCVCEGAPPPTITWYTCHTPKSCSWKNHTAAWENITRVKENGVAQISSELRLSSLTSVTSVRCEVKNAAGHRVRDLRVVSSLLSQVPVLSSILVLVLVAIFFLIILITLWRKKPHYEVRWKVIESVSVDCQHYTYIDPGCLPYDSAWEIPRDSIVLGKVLGLGAFGRVVEANISGLIGPDSTTKVAVKMVKQNNSSVQSLMSELKVLVHLGPHLNVVNLLGACTTPTGPVYVITEFCHHGDLLNYLHKNKHTFLQTDAQTESDGGYMDMSEEKNTQYVAMKTINSTQIEPTVYETPYPSLDETFLLLDDSSALSHNDLLSFSYQIAQAMDFLSSKNCVHRDLAARNALVCEGKLVKICDFGLARDLTKDQNYIARGNNFLPLKWMAPESVFKSVYSSQSDVWSYGILLWEIFSLGESPYPDIPRTRDFYSALRRGYRMTCPDHTPQTVYNLMTECWMEKPEARPSFTSVVSTFRNMMSDDYNKRYVRMTEEFLKGQNPAAVRFRAGQTHESPISEDKVRLLEVGPEEAGPSCSS